MNQSPTDMPNTGIGLADAATAFEAFLDREDGTQTPERDAPEAPAEEAEALEASTDTEETPDAEEPAEGAEDEEAGTGEDEAPQFADPKQLVTVKIDGKSEQVTVEELASGYQLAKVSYARLEQAAEDRKVLSAEYQQVIQERQQYATLLSELAAQLEAGQEREPDWQKLYDEDPLGYVRQKQVWDDRKSHLQAVKAEQARVEALQEQEAKAHMQKVIQAGREKLLDIFPAWKDPAKAEAGRQAIRSYAVEKAGYSEEEIARTFDPRAVAVLEKARRYDEMMAKRPQPVERPAPRSAPAGSPNTAPKRTTEVTRQKQRLAKTGHIRDAAKLFESLL